MSFAIRASGVLKIFLSWLVLANIHLADIPQNKKKKSIRWNKITETKLIYDFCAIRLLLLRM